MNELAMMNIPNAETYPPHILVVDDEPIFVELVSIWLERANFLVTPVFSGQEALSVLENQPTDCDDEERSSPFDLVLLDVMMPDMRGTQVCRQIRANAHTAQIPVLVLTALSSSVERVEALEAGANDYLTKPFIGLELLARVGNLVRWYRAERKARAEVRLRNQELNALNEIATTLNQTLALPNLMRQALDTICQTTGFGWGGIYLLTPNIDHLELIAQRGMPSVFLQDGERIPHDDSLLWQVIEHACPIATKSSNAGQLQAGLTDAQLAGTEHLVMDAYHCVLLAAKGQPVGLMVIGGEAHNTLSPEKVRLLEAIGHQISATVTHAKLSTQIESYQEQLADLHEQVAKLNVSTTKLC